MVKCVVGTCASEPLQWIPGLYFLHTHPFVALHMQKFKPGDEASIHLAKELINKH